MRKSDPCEKERSMDAEGNEKNLLRNPLGTAQLEQFG
jgi:hypothetical protein